MSQIEDQDICPICLDDQPEFKLECNHMFHKSCIEKVYKYAVQDTKSTPSCPICRSEIDNPEFFSKYKTKGILNSILILTTEFANHILLLEYEDDVPQEEVENMTRAAIFEMFIEILSETS